MPLRLFPTLLPLNVQFNIIKILYTPRRNSLACIHMDSLYLFVLLLLFVLCVGMAACQTMFGLRVPFRGEPPAIELSYQLSYQLSYPSSIWQVCQLYGGWPFSLHALLFGTRP